MHRRHHSLPLFFLLTLLVTLAGCGKREDRSGAGSSSPPGTTAQGPATAHHAALEVHDALSIDLSPDVSPSDAAHRLDALVASSRGFVEESSLQGTDDE